MKDFIQLENHEDERSVFGTILFDDIILERQVQGSKRFKAKSIGECIIEVYPNEGSIPHFHIHNKDNSFSTCVRIYENLYFSHGGKYYSRFNSKQCRQLNDYLKQEYKNIFDIKITIWQAIVLFWENDNRQCNYKYKTNEQPHYEDMMYFRDEE